MSQSAVYQALVAAVKAVPGMIPFSTPALKFTPPVSGPYADLAIVWNTPETFTLGDEGEDMLTGFLQLTLQYPPDKGIFEPSRMSDVLRESFKAGRRKVYEGQEVIIKNSGPGQYTILDGKLVNPFTVYFYALIKR